jgi:hypothetical protein
LFQLLEEKWPLDRGPRLAHHPPPLEGLPLGRRNRRLRVGAQILGPEDREMMLMGTLRVTSSLFIILQRRARGQVLQ